MASENAPSPLMSIVSGVTARTQGMKPATAPTIGAVDTAGPPTIVIMNAPPLILPAAPLRALFPLIIVTWALSVPPLWSGEMTPMRRALLLGITTETWKALPRTDRWNCQHRRRVMSRSACSAPLIFPNYPLRFPSIFPMFHPFIYLKPSDCEPRISYHLKTLIPFRIYPLLLL